ncbi:copper chaperone PCu(A)C [Phenylobacterium sp.]|uniref:copper chaperone PCu(A)C n=1 Tax=Phenylobacterium sp. TaxID=1871053 RepID=UPI002734B151|nr:copper chaperone PCu(A)C [Phenylobacterium sp.]MDP3854908.1 copper chaperone PCu(A)C [Phenylobacterium sp.]
MKTLYALLPLVLVAACGRAPEAPSTVTVADAWCRAAPVGAMAGGCYVTLTASADDRLVAVETTAADHAEIHTMDVTGEVMRMRQLKDGLALPAGDAVSLAPGGEHLMIIRPKQTLAAGETLPLTLRFQKAPPRSLAAPIRTPDAAMAHGGDHR